MTVPFVVVESCDSGGASRAARGRYARLAWDGGVSESTIEQVYVPQ